MFVCLWTHLNIHLVVAASFMVTVFFWSLVNEGRVQVVSVLSHGVAFLIILIDVMVSRQPFLLLHVIYFMVYGVIYLIFSYIDYATRLGNEKGKRYIYRSMNWSNASAPLLGSIFIIVGMPIGYGLIWILLAKRRGPRAAMVTDHTAVPRQELLISS
jgi:hypothetical protein